MSFIVDIDLDYFRLFKDPLRRLDQVLKCAGRPVDFIVDHHHQVVERWEAAISEGIIGSRRLSFTLMSTTTCSANSRR